MRTKSKTGGRKKSTALSTLSRDDMRTAIQAQQGEINELERKLAERTAKLRQLSAKTGRNKHRKAPKSAVEDANARKIRMAVADAVFANPNLSPAMVGWDSLFCADLVPKLNSPEGVH
ncbi:hypothetical protein THAOC_08024, partial [Thalassiosira oceanica]